MKLHSNRLQRVLDKWPGKKYFGIYRFLPMFFVLGAALEFSMINWEVGETNFCTFPFPLYIFILKLIKILQTVYINVDKQKVWLNRHFQNLEKLSNQHACRSVLEPILEVSHSVIIYHVLRCTNCSLLL